MMPTRPVGGNGGILEKTLIFRGAAGFWIV